MRSLFLFLAISFFAGFSGCEPECEDCDYDTDTEIGEELPPIQQAIVRAAYEGAIVSTVADEDGIVEITGVIGVEWAFVWEVFGLPETEFFRIYGSLSVREINQALATCPALGLPSPEYDWFCVEENPNGRVIARESTEPTLDSIQVYDEYPSVAYPTEMTSKLYFSQKPEHYPNHWGGPWQAMRGQVTSWGAGWNNARVDWCDHPVHGERCNQD